MCQKLLTSLFFFVGTVVSSSPCFGGHLHHHGLPHHSIIVVSQTVINTQSRTPTAKKKVYIPARWIESREGILVLEPGRWTETETVRNEK